VWDGRIGGGGGGAKSLSLREDIFLVLQRLDVLHVLLVERPSNLAQ